MIVRAKPERGNERPGASADPSRPPLRIARLSARAERLTDVPDSCYRRVGFSVNESEESVYGDQGQEVAWEVGQDRCKAKRQQEETEEHEVARPVRIRRRDLEQHTKRVFVASGFVGEESVQLEEQRREELFS